MAKILEKKEAISLMEDSDKRKESIINMTNKLITEAALDGRTHCAFPSPLTQKEIDWLVDELVLLGYEIKNGRSTIGWR